MPRQKITRAQPSLSRAAAAAPCRQSMVAQIPVAEPRVAFRSRRAVCSGGHARRRLRFLLLKLRRRAPQPVSLSIRRRKKDDLKQRVLRTPKESRIRISSSIETLACTVSPPPPLLRALRPLRPPLSPPRELRDLRTAAAAATAASDGVFRTRALLWSQPGMRSRQRRAEHRLDATQGVG